MKALENTARFLILTILTGTIMGLASAAFLKSLEIVTVLREQSGWLIFLLPVTGVLTALMYRKYGKGAQRGSNLVIESVHEDVRVPFRMTVFSFAFTVLTHLTGGSAGREGTAVQIGGALSNRLAVRARLDKTGQRILVMAGISAGFGSVFGTPLAGAFFGMEMCFVGKLSYEALLPCFIASFTADLVTAALGITHATRRIAAIPALSPYPVAIVFAAAIVFGYCGKYFAIAVHAIKKRYARHFKDDLVRALAASLVVLGVMLLINGVRYAGLSTWMIDAAFQGTASLWDPIRKFLLTVLTLGAGLQGGEATPLFDIGASLGSLIGQLTHVEPSLLAALGLIGVFGCAANIPITTIVLGIEMFGTKAVPYYVITALVSYYLTGHHGIYSAQVIAIPKRRHMPNLVGRSIGDQARKDSDADDARAGH